jgi:hypothetical protein
LINGVPPYFSTVVPLFLVGLQIPLSSGVHYNKVLAEREREREREREWGSG